MGPLWATQLSVMTAALLSISLCFARLGDPAVGHDRSTVEYQPVYRKIRCDACMRSLATPPQPLQSLPFLQLAHPTCFNFNCNWQLIRVCVWVQPRSESGGK